MRPVVVLMDEDTIERLAPFLTRVTDRLVAEYATNYDWRDLMERNGWTWEMLAWSLILRAATDVELELLTNEAASHDGA